MTPREAMQLRPGDTVRFTNVPTRPGRVLRLIEDCLIIRWASGTVVCYSLGCMQHIERDPEPTHVPH